MLAERKQLLANGGAGRHTVRQHNAGQHLFFADLIGRGQHRYLVHLGVGQQHGLHLGSRNVLARAADDVLAPVHKVQQTIRILQHHIAGVEPAAFPGLGGGLGVVQVLAEKMLARGLGRVAHQHLAWRAGRHRLAGLIRYPHLQPWRTTAKGARAHLAVVAMVGDSAHHLGHAPELDERKAKALLEGGMQLRLYPRAIAKAHTVLLFPIRWGLLEQEGNDHAQVVNDGGAAAGHLLPPAAGLKAVGLDLAAAAQQHAVERQDGGVDVEQRQRVEQALAAFLDRHMAGVGRIPLASGQLIGMRQHTALGLAGGARGVEDARGRVGAQAARGLRACWRQRDGAAVLRIGTDQRRLVARVLQALLQRLQPLGQTNDQVQLRMVDQVVQLAALVVGVDGHAADAQAVHRQLVPEVLGPALQKQTYAVAHAIAGRLVAGLQPCNMGTGLRVTELAALGQVAALGVGRHGQQAVVRVARNGGLQGLANGGVVGDGDHVGGLQGRFRAGSTATEWGRSAGPARPAFQPPGCAKRRHAAAGSSSSAG